MAQVYLVTGKLGSGKSLATVGRIRDYLNQGRPVATNLDLYLEKMVDPWAKKCRVTRLPDKPTVDDLENLPEPYTGKYDESKTGLIVLDECGTWFNTREYRDKSRQPLINKLLHIRKAGWDVMFIIQHMDMIDKQVREGLGEHVVTCQRADRLGIPFITPLLKLLGANVRPPKIHLGLVRYGTSTLSPVVDRWIYKGADLYDSYDTRQVFGANDCQMHSILPPYTIYGRYISRKEHAKKSAKQTFESTKNILVTWKRPFFLLGLCVGLIGNWFTGPQPQQAVAQEQTHTKKNEDEQISEEDETEVYNPLNGLYISGSVKTNTGFDYIMYNQYGDHVSPSNIGFTLRGIDFCKAVLITENHSRVITCSASKPLPVKNKLTPDELLAQANPPART